MLARGLWFAAGAGAGVYAMTRARRVAESFTVDGLKDRWNGITVGWQMFTDELVTESQAREAELRERYHLAPLAPHQLPELNSGS